MPTYVYVDPESGDKYEFPMTIAEMLCREEERPDWIKFEGRWLKRDLASEHAPTSGGCGIWPMRSDAAGVHPDQTGEAHENSVRLGVPTQFDRRTGQAIFTDRTHRKRYLSAVGFIDRNGGYGD